MHVTPVDSDEVLDAVNEALDGDKVAKNVATVDITFTNTEDKEIEPIVPSASRCGLWLCRRLKSRLSSMWTT